MRRQREITLHYLLIRYTHAHIYFIIAPLSTHWLYFTITYILEDERGASMCRDTKKSVTIPIPNPTTDCKSATTNSWWWCCYR